MTASAITVKDLTKRFQFSVKDPTAGWLKNLFAPAQKTIVAVDSISFEVPQGQRLAFIGPNGAGKSTTIKMLTGILHPTEGQLNVLGLNPATDRKKLAYQVGTVFGQRSQLLPNLPLNDSLRFFGVMYDLSNSVIEKRIEELSEIFNLKEFGDQPVRKLSLGQRMRGEMAASLMHKPKIVFLDEPTIGLDVVAKKAFRELLLAINETEKTTIFLTSHDVGDIEALCERTIVVNHGEIVLDSPTADLGRQYIQKKVIELIAQTTFTRFAPLPAGLSYKEQTPGKITVEVDLKVVSTQEALRLLLEIYEVADINVSNPELEEVIRAIYERNKAG